MTSVNEVLIIGAGDHGRGTLEILLAAGGGHASFEVRGFLDENPAKTGSLVGGVPVLGGLDWLRTNRHARLHCIIAIADCRAKQVLAERLAAFGVEFISAVHPSAVVGRGVTIAPGAIINAGVAVAYDTVIEEHCTVNLNATVGHDCRIGKFSTVAPGANIAGRVSIGDGCDVSLNATIVKGTRVGSWTTIGPGAVVLRDVPSDVRVFGNPARVVDPSRTAPSLVNG